MVASLIWTFALNTVALVCLLFGIYYAFQFHRKPVFAWKIPLHLSYQEIGIVVHSRNLAQYDSERWNLDTSMVVSACGG